MTPKIRVKDKFYYARIIHEVGIYDVINLIVRSVYDTYFVCTEKQQRAYLFDTKDINVCVFSNRNDALLKVKEAEKYKRKISNEIYYEED